MYPTIFFLAEVMNALVLKVTGGNYTGPLNGVYLGLYQSPTANLNKSSLMAAITEATYGGYARQPLVWYPPFVDSAGPEAIQAASVNFVPSSSTTPNTITGLFLADALSAGDLLAWYPLPGVGFGMSSPQTAMQVMVPFQLPFTNTYGQPTILN